MKIRKLIAGMLTLALGMSVGAPALAAEAADARLTQVTQTVIGTLDISGDYTDFYGEPYENPLGTRWELNWSAEDKSLNVTATDAGKITNLYYWENSDVVVRSNSYGPTFPEMTRAQAQTYAEAFLKKVFAANETPEFNEGGSDTLSATSYSFGGTILLNGVASPMTFSVRVRLSDGKVTNFWRGDESEYAGTVPSPDTVTTTEKAGELLKGTIALRLEYVLSEGEDKVAVLRYLPEAGDDYYVDAATGNLVNLSELQRLLNRDYNGASGGSMKTMNTADAAETEMVASTSTRALTEAELAGVAKLEDVLDQEALEKAVKAWTELGLTGYGVASVSYSVDRETDEVTARVTLSKNTEEGIYRRNVVVDAKTGELLSMYSSNPWASEAGEVKLDEGEALKAAFAFLNKLWPAQAEKVEVYRDISTPANARGTFSITLSQKVNGYFFPGNSIYVSVDPVDGTIRGFSKSFDDAVTFDSDEGIISVQAAIDAWAKSFPVDFGYMEVPVALNMEEPAYKLLWEAGYRYYNGLKPGYGYGERDAWYTGVDAKTGELVQGYRYTEPDKVTYSDISGHWARTALEELAAYNVGWFGGKADPDGALTQSQYLVLLLSADGYRFDDLTKADQMDELYRTAVRRGMLTAGERSENKVLTRAEMVKMLLDSLGYGPVAGLQGIFKVSFTDADAIAEADLGYAALAQGLGIVKGDGQGRYAPDRQATRAEAAVMLWQYMKK